MELLHRRVTSAIERWGRRTAAPPSCHDAYLSLDYVLSDHAACGGIPVLPGDSHYHHRGGELLRLHDDVNHPGLHPPELRGAAAVSGHLADLSADRRVRADHLGADVPDRLYARLFPGVPRPLGDVAAGAVPGLHDPVLDLKRHPHDLVDPVPWTQRARQPDAAADGPDPAAARVPALFELRGRAGLRAS